jgi:type I restriction-modification system DNA methylase subunit
MRGHMDASEYKHVCLGLIFLKYISDAFEEKREQLLFGFSDPKSKWFSEQTRIVAEVERRLSLVEELESVVSANLQRATRLRQSILQKAFTGELT